jgi:hypothetical protein
MFIERISNRNSAPAILIRESYREGEKVKKRRDLPRQNANSWTSGLKG